MALSEDVTLTFEGFWSWLQEHPDCIVEAGTGDCALYDQPDFHWQVGENVDGEPRLQLLWGKELIAEIVVDARHVMYVESTADPEPDDEKRTLFEFVSAHGQEGYVSYHFLLAHGLDEGEEEEGLGNGRPARRGSRPAEA